MRWSVFDYNHKFFLISRFMILWSRCQRLNYISWKTIHWLLAKSPTFPWRSLKSESKPLSWRYLTTCRITIATVLQNFSLRSTGWNHPRSVDSLKSTSAVKGLSAHLLRKRSSKVIVRSRRVCTFHFYRLRFFVSWKTRRFVSRWPTVSCRPSSSINSWKKVLDGCQNHTARLEQRIDGQSWHQKYISYLFWGDNRPLFLCAGLKYGDVTCQNVILLITMRVSVAK